MSPTITEEDRAQEIFVDLKEDYTVDVTSLHHDELQAMFNNLAAAASITAVNWNVHPAPAVTTVITTGYAVRTIIISSFPRKRESSNTLTSNLLDSGSPLRFARNDDLIRGSLGV